VDQLITSKDQILDKEYKEKIDLLTIENNSLKQELELANSKVKEKEIENNKLKTKLNIFEKSGDESLKNRLENLEFDIDKLKSGLDNKTSVKNDNNNYNSNNSSDNNKYEEEIKTLKNDLFDKDSMLYTYDLKLKEQEKK